MHNLFYFSPTVIDILLKSIKQIFKSILIIIVFSIGCCIIAALAYGFFLAGLFFESHHEKVFFIFSWIVLGILAASHLLISVCFINCHNKNPESDFFGNRLIVIFVLFALFFIWEFSIFCFIDMNKLHYYSILAVLKTCSLLFFIIVFSIGIEFEKWK